jgi:hypothetical protein
MKKAVLAIAARLGQRSRVHPEATNLKFGVRVTDAG